MLIILKRDLSNPEQSWDLERLESWVVSHSNLDHQYILHHGPCDHASMMTNSLLDPCTTSRYALFLITFGLFVLILLFVYWIVKIENARNLAKFKKKSKVRLSERFSRSWQGVHSQQKCENNERRIFKTLELSPSEMVQRYFLPKPFLLDHYLLVNTLGKRNNLADNWQQKEFF